MLYPMSFMVLLTLVMGCIAIYARLRAVKNGDVTIAYFKLMEDDNTPDFIVKTSRNFNNQFEVPVLFYVVSVLFISLKIESMVALILAWFFVVLRCLHSYIHLTYNHILHRLITFWAAFICVIGLWWNLLHLTS